MQTACQAGAATNPAARARGRTGGAGKSYPPSRSYRRTVPSRVSDNGAPRGRRAGTGAALLSPQRGRHGRKEEEETR